MPSPSDLDPSHDPLVGRTLGGKYTLERVIGRGGVGVVYLATTTDEGLPDRVVVKMIQPSLASQPQVTARFEREAKRLDELRHSNVVEVHDHGSEDGRPYIVMEWVDGELLSDALARKGSLSLDEFVPIAAQLLKGFGHAHSRDRMIRDIKPENVMLLERKGRANFVKIIDLGLAQLLDGDENITKQHVVGTAGYLSPEQIEEREMDLRVDVYALGVLFYQMLSGRMPFEAESEAALLYKHVHDAPAPLAEVLPEDHHVPGDLVALIHDCLEKDPNDRPSDANEIVERLIDCVPMSLFRLPLAKGATTSGSVVSALSTAALAAPTRQGAPSREPQTPAIGSAVATAPEEATGPDLQSANPPGRGKHRLIVGGLLGGVALTFGAYVMLGASNEEEHAASVAAPPEQMPEPSAAALGSPSSEVGTIAIRSEPVADLTIDGVAVGRTPYANPLPPGRHTLGMTAKGYEPWTREVEIHAGTNPPIEVELEREAAPRAEPDDQPRIDLPFEPEAKPGKKRGGTTPKPADEPVADAEPKKSEPPASKPKPVSEPSEPAPAKPAKENPFLPTTKKKQGGPFLPTEK